MCAQELRSIVQLYVRINQQYTIACVNLITYVFALVSSLCVYICVRALRDWAVFYSPYFLETIKFSTCISTCRHILELGAGIGFAGIALCYMCQPKGYHFTDCHAEVLQRLRENVEINLEGTMPWCVVNHYTPSSYNFDLGCHSQTLFMLSMHFTRPLMSVVTCSPCHVCQ